MSDRYLPPSDFLRAVIDEDVQIGGSEFGDRNLKRLIAMVGDVDPANRDWATMLLSQLELDTPEVRAALIEAASDENNVVRGEAVLGLAQLDRSLALPFLQRELAGSVVCMPLLEAAIIVADASLCDDLESFSSPSENAMLDQLVVEALAACRRG